MQWATSGLGMNPPPPKKRKEKNVALKNAIFRGLMLSLGHFGQQVPESPVSQLQNSDLLYLLPLGKF